jgi:putative ABC transport system permease protein
MFKNYLKIAYRNLVKNKIYSLINIVGLAMGMACAILIVLWVDYELSYDTFHEKAGRLYRVVFTNEQKEFHGYWQPGPLAQYLKETFPEIERAANYAERRSKLSYGTKGFFCSGAIVGSDFFQMFSFPLEKGNPANVLDNPGSILISKSLARKLFGESEPVGKILKMDDNPGLLVAGVFSDAPPTSHIQFDFAIPFSGAPDWMKLWDRKCVSAYVLLRENAVLDDVNGKIRGVMNEHNPTWKNILYLFPMTKSHLYEPGGTGRIVYVYIFSIFGFLVLFVACVNFMNLSTARSEKRMKEIGIKKTVGSTRAELVTQFLIETLVLSFLSLLIAIVLIELVLPYANSILNTRITMAYSTKIILALLGITILTGLLAGSYPAVYLSSFEPIQMLSGRIAAHGEHHSSFLRKTLVIVQFAFSIFIIICVLFITGQLDFIRSRDLGFNKEQVVLISTRGALVQKVSLVKDELLKLPFVKDVSVSATNLTSSEGAGSGPVDWEGKNPDRLMEVGFDFVDEDFAKTFQITMAEGRFFSKAFSTDMQDAVVVNETAVKEMGLTNPVGKRLTTWFGRKGTIVGVVHDFNTQSLRDAMTPVVFIPTRTANNLCVRIAPADISSSIRAIESKIKEIVPDDPFEFQFIDEKIDSLYKTEQMAGKLASFIAVLAIVISCLGLFGLASFSSERRTKEIGIRKVIGASVPALIVMLFKDFTQWVLLANLIAWPLGWYAMSRWLQNFAYRIDMNWWVFVVSGGIALAVALATVSFQAIKAATANPVEALRYE